MNSTSKKNPIPGENNSKSLDGLTWNSLASERMAWILLSVVLSILVLTNLAGLGNPIVEAHGFRQTQTAITAYYLKLNGFKLDYETPAVGYPWSIPFEFPIYQYITALISKSTSLPLTNAGRLVSLVFTLLSAFPIWQALKNLHFSKFTRLLGLTLFFSSPVYMFWSGTFMIESAALFFTLYFMYFTLNVLGGNKSTANLLGMGVFLLLAGLQKITTVLTPLVILGVVYVSQQGFRNIFKNLGWTVKLVLALLIPLGLSYLWIRYSDQVKSLNPIGLKLTSAYLSQWNYGTLSQRLSSRLWYDVIYYRNILKMSGQFLGLLTLIYYFKCSKNVPQKKIIGISLSLFLAPFLVFTNLHMVHSYYQVSNSVFFSLGLGIALAALLDQAKTEKARRYLHVLISLIIVSNLYFYLKGSFKDKVIGFDASNNSVLALAKHIKDHTPPDRPVIWYGQDWSSEGPFYAERRSLAIPAWVDQLDPIIHMERYLKEAPSAIVLCETPGKESVRQAILDYAKNVPLVSQTEVAKCEVFQFL